MLIGLVSGSRSARRSSQSWSPHSCWESNTTDAVAGGTWARLASGSALACQVPSGPQMSYL